MYRVLGALALAAAALTPIPGHAAPRCANDLELRNEWSAVPQPYAPGPFAMAQADDDPCVMVATDATRHIYRTTDGGTTWRQTATASADVVRPVMGTLAQDRVALVLSTGGLLVSSDGARSFHAASGLDGVHVLDLRADPTERGRVYATGRSDSNLPVTPPAGVPNLPTAGPSIWTSADFGTSWSAVAASAAFSATHVTIDEDDSNLVWADSASAGVWLSDDRGVTWVSKDTATATDVDTATLDGGGTVVLASTATGLRRTVDGGDTWSTRLATDNVKELVFETGHPAAFMMVANGSVLRSSDHGGTAHEEAEGLPQGCGPHGLVADGSAPSTFLVTCTSTGLVYRYRDDGHDWGWIDPGDPTNPIGIAPRLPHRAMDLLAQLDLPDDSDGHSAAIAFDGQLLYYADDNHDGVISRVDAKTGSRAPALHLAINGGVSGLTYDSLHHLLYVLDRGGRMNRVDLRTGKVTDLFHDPVNVYGSGYAATSYSYDPAIGRFHAVFDGSGDLYEITTDGRVTAQCTIPSSLLYQRSDQPAPGLGDGGVNGPSAVVASGDGGVYIQTEDDTTIVRLDRSCTPLAIFTHRTFSEAADENDQIACDTNTFDVPAIWIRDANAQAAFAYAVPGGYCALATRLRVTTSPVVANVDSAPVCAELRLAGKNLPVRGEDVAMFVGRHAIGTAKTGADGVACATYHPADFPEHYSPSPPQVGQKPIDTREREQVVANYLGTIAYRPARALGHAVVTTFVPPLLPLPKPVVEPAAAAIVAAPPPLLPVAPPQPPPPQPQPQPLAQGHPGVQPGALGQPGAAADRQHEVEAADQSADVREFTARAPDSPSPLPAEVAGFAFAAYLLEQRRRRSRVREVAG